MSSADPSEKRPWLLHKINWSNRLSGAADVNIVEILSDGFLRSGGELGRKKLAKASLITFPSTSPDDVFLRLGTPRDITNIASGAVLALDARALLLHDFYLNVGWGGGRGGTRVHGRKLTDDRLFAELGRLNRERDLEFLLNRASAKALMCAHTFEISNEVLVGGAIPLHPYLRAVYVYTPDPRPDGRPTYGAVSATGVVMLREFLEKNYPGVAIIPYDARAQKQAFEAALEIRMAKRAARKIET